MACKLHAVKIKNLSEPGRYGDGGGLWLQVRDLDHRSWLYRYQMNGRARQMGLGPFPDVPLSEAREEAQRCRGLVRSFIDPIEQKQQLKADAAAKAGVETFRKVAERYIAAHANSWSNPKHRAQWGATLATYVYPAFGNRSVAAVATGDVMRVIEPIWRTKPETAARVRGRIEAVLDYATARGWRHGDNPARWRGHVANLLPARSKVAPQQHHSALPWQEMSAFLRTIRAEAGTSPLALEFAILTAARTGEVIGAKWSEIDMAEATWTIPAERMKAKKEHRIPLSRPALAVLSKLLPNRPAEGDGFVFPGGKVGSAMSNMGMNMLLRRIKREDLTVHGFRSTFRDWVSETTAYPGDVAEAALAHTVKGRVEAADRRGDLFEKRRAMMADWAAHCERAAGAGAVVKMASMAAVQASA